jgi:putative oxidoreductase
MDVIFLIGRILFATLFVMSGYAIHLRGRAQGVQYARMYNAPAPELLVPLTGVMIVVGGIMIALGLWGDVGALLIVAFLVGITPIMHAFWKEEDPMQRGNQMAHFQKNVSLAGAALIVFYAFAKLGDDASLTLTDPLF